MTSTVTRPNPSSSAERCSSRLNAIFKTRSVGCSESRAPYRAAMLRSYLSMQPMDSRPRRKVVGARSLGHSAGEAKRVTQSQGCRSPKTYRHPPSDVDRWHPVPQVIQGGRGSIIASSIFHQSAGDTVPAGTIQLKDRLQCNLK